MERKHYRTEKDLDIKEFIDICNSAITMAEAARQMNVHMNTLIRLAKKYDCYRPNMGGKGLKKNSASNKLIPLSEIIKGLYPNYQTYKLKLRLIKEGIKELKCEICGNTKWLSGDIPLELDHIDGNSRNHKIENLRMICPNCHAKTPTYRGKNKAGMVEW